MTPKLLAWIKSLIANGDMRPFYWIWKWKRLRNEVLEDDKHECQWCKAKGLYAEANHVHHVNHVRKRPDLALSRFYIDDDENIKRNLISLCNNCHETIAHPERLKRVVKEPITKERW